MLYWNRLLAPIRERESSVQKTKNDNRSPFKKDFDTICNSNVLRRLQDKAQVFPLEEGDYARTRLTHSLEVMSIAESLGIELTREIRKKKNNKYLTDPKFDNNCGRLTARVLIEDIPVILTGAALLHDMGNPPFGHLAEQIINDWFRERLNRIEKNGNTGLYEYTDLSRNSLQNVLKGGYYDDLVHFDGNAQLLRLVTKLSLVVDDKGMNLTYPMMAAFIKYPCDASHIDKNTLSRKKAGYFQSESDIFEDIIEKLGLNNHKFCRHPLSFLIEAADDIAYLTADIEDAHHKGIISIGDIKKYLDRFGDESLLVRKIQSQIGLYYKDADKLNVPRHDDYVMHRLRVLLKGEMISAIGNVFSDKYSAIMNGECNDELLMISDAKELVTALKELETEEVYYCEEITKSKTRAAVIIKKLLDMYVLGILNYDKEIDDGKDTENNFIYRSFSYNYRYICETLNKDADEKAIIYNKLRLVIDQISGMTDSRALSIYHTLTAG